ncbi:MAG: ATP-binding protein [Verrucomicrobiota bacterium]
MRSLRTKLVVLSTLISGVTIIGLGALSWISTANTYRHSIDLQLEEKVRRVMRGLHPRMDQAQLRDHLQISFGDEIEEGLRFIRVVDEIDETVLFEGPSQQIWVKQLPLIFQKSDHELPARSEQMAASPPPQHRMRRRLRLGHQDSQNRHHPPFPPDKAPPPHGENESITHFETSRINGDLWRFAINRQRGYAVLMGLELSRAQSDLNQLGTLYLISIPIALCLIGIGGWLVADRTLRPLRLITKTARLISAEELNSRIPENPRNDAEIAELTSVLNAMMERLEKSFFLANRFSADVSHELKTPIAIMQGEVESALKECDAESRHEQNLTVIRDEIQRLKAITRELMLLAQADIGQLIRKMEVFDLSEEVEALAEDARILTKEANLTLDSQIEAQIQIKGDSVLIRQALLNLIVNAIKYNHPEGTVRIILTLEKPDLLLFAVENTGPGIPVDDREKVFQRFHRGDKARTRDVEGFGLGLCLALEIIRGHSGELKLSQADEKITRFEITLPTVPSELPENKI